MWVLSTSLLVVTACSDESSSPQPTAPPASMPTSAAVDTVPVPPTAPAPSTPSRDISDTAQTSASQVPATPSLPATPPSTLPVVLADRTTYPSCGEDFSLSLDAAGPPSVSRRCFLDANTKRARAELLTHELTELASAPYLIYRTNDDQSVDIYIPGTPWQVAHCGGLHANQLRVFEIVDCDEPVELR